MPPHNLHFCLRTRIHDIPAASLDVRYPSAFFHTRLLTANLFSKHIVKQMASTTAGLGTIPQKDIESFQAHLSNSTRILALLGAGLSASSGLPTFRGAGGLWRTHDAVQLATPEAFERDPGLVWQFYSYRRHMALRAKPNPAHYALAELARKNDQFLTLSQNVDGAHSLLSSPAVGLSSLTKYSQ